MATEYCQKTKKELTQSFIQSARYFHPLLNKSRFSGQIFIKASSNKFHVNPSSGSCTDICGRTDGQTDRQTNMMRVIDAIREYANAPKNTAHLFHLLSVSRAFKPFSRRTQGMYTENVNYTRLYTTFSLICDV